MELPDSLLPTTLDFLPVYILFGVLCGIASWAFVKLLYGTEDFFERLPGGPYGQAVIGMTGVGVLLYVLQQTVGNYYVDGVGYGTIQAILTDQIAAVELLALLFFAKLAATSISLGAGASGGIFSPSLFMGATLGGAFGGVLAHLWPQLGFNSIQFAIIGMAAIVGGGTGAAMTAIFMIFEMTADYTVIVPLIIAVACSVGVRRMLSSENIYTLKLARRGRHIPKERHTNMFLVRHATDVMKPVSAVQDTGAAAGEGVPAADSGKDYLLVSRGRHVVGIRPPVAPGCTCRGELERDYVIVRDTDIMNDVLRRMGARKRNYALVVRGSGVPHADDVVGVISRNEVADQVLQHFQR